MNATTGKPTLTQILQDGDVTFHDVQGRCVVKDVDCFTNEPWPNNTSKQRNCSTPTKIRHIRGCRDALKTVGAGAATDTAGAGSVCSTPGAGVQGCRWHVSWLGWRQRCTRQQVLTHCRYTSGTGAMHSHFQRETHQKYYFGAPELLDGEDGLLGARQNFPTQNSDRYRSLRPRDKISLTSRAVTIVR